MEKGELKARMQVPKVPLYLRNTICEIRYATISSLFFQNKIFLHLRNTKYEIRNTTQLKLRLLFLLCFMYGYTFAQVKPQPQPQPKPHSQPQPKPHSQPQPQPQPHSQPQPQPQPHSQPQPQPHPHPPKPQVVMKAPNYLDTILLKNPEYFSEIMLSPKIHHVQIVYTQINRDKNNKASFTTYTYRVNRAEFFYAASTVKLPICALAMERMEELKKTGVTINSVMLTDRAHACQSITHTDETSATGFPSIAQYIKRMLLVSDNTAMSRMYEFLTPEYINKKLWSKGFPTARIRIRFDINCLGLPNNFTNPIRFLNDTGKLIYSQPAKYWAVNTLSMPVANTIKLIDMKDPDYSIKKDFSHSNFLCLSDMHEMLKSVMFPREAPVNRGFKMSNENRRFLWKYLQMMPYESDYPNYPDRQHYIDSYKKYFFYGQDSAIIENKNIRIFNVVGESYGYTTDCAYIVDFTNKVEFMISATYFVQKANGVIDGTDECYNKFIMPFFKNIGQSVYLYELSRKKKFLPDLLEYKF
jgi:hypothetical protein